MKTHRANWCQIVLVLGLGGGEHRLRRARRRCLHEHARRGGGPSPACLRRGVRLAGPTSGANAVSTRLYQIAREIYLDHATRLMGSPHDSSAECVEPRGSIGSALATISPDVRSALVLFDVEGVASEDICGDRDDDGRRGEIARIPRSRTFAERSRRSGLRCSQCDASRTHTAKRGARASRRFSF
jgi:hypothetical protein